jgi:hypothetical protein
MTHRLIAAAILASAALTLSAAAVADDTSARKTDKTATNQPAGCTPWAQKDFVHPPLKCMEPYLRIDAYPVSAWCFHGADSTKAPYCDEYVQRAKAVGFNVLIDDERIIPYAEKVGGIKVQMVTLSNRQWRGPEWLDANIFKGKVGDSPVLQGFIVGDNGRGFGGVAIKTAEWLKQKYPHVMTIMSMYPSRVPGNTALRILHMQNYPYLRGARGDKAAKAYLSECESNRVFCNNNDMAAFECYGGVTPFSCVRFQIVGAMAYGAQGLSNFAYVPHRIADYKPDSAMIPLWSKMHKYVIDVLGRHLWGTRSMGVLHSVHGGAHNGAKGFDAGQLVVRAGEFVMVGLLTPEAKFGSKDPADKAVPEYFMVVDKRTGGNTPGARDAFVMLSTKIAVVEFLDAESTVNAKIRRLVPGFKVRMKTEGSDARLLRVAPDLEKLLGGADGLKLYDQVNRTMAELQWKATPPAKEGETKAEADLPLTPVDARQIDQAVKAAKAKAAELEKLLAAAVKGGTISREQADDTLKRLNEAIDATAAEAKAPKPAEN